MTLLRAYTQKTSGGGLHGRRRCRYGGPAAAAGLSAGGIHGSFALPPAQSVPASIPRRLLQGAFPAEHRSPPYHTGPVFFASPLHGNPPQHPLASMRAFMLLTLSLLAACRIFRPPPCAPLRGLCGVRLHKALQRFGNHHRQRGVGEHFHCAAQQRGRPDCRAKRAVDERTAEKKEQP